MTSELSHSIPGGPAHAALSRTRQIGLHVAGTGLSIGLLLKAFSKIRDDPPTPKTTSILVHIDKTLHYFLEHAALIDILLNQEEIYLAAQILGIAEADVDKIPKRIWATYHGAMADIGRASNWAGLLFDSLGSHVIGAVNELDLIRYEIVVDGIDFEG